MVDGGCLWGGGRLTDLENLKLRSYYRGRDNFSILEADIRLLSWLRRYIETTTIFFASVSYYPNLLFEIGYCHFARRGFTKKDAAANTYSGGVWSRGKCENRRGKKMKRRR